MPGRGSPARLHARLHRLPALDARSLRLHGWVRAVSERLRLSDQLALRSRVEEELNSQATGAWQVNFTLADVIHTCARVAGTQSRPVV